MQNTIEKEEKGKTKTGKKRSRKKLLWLIIPAAVLILLLVFFLRMRGAADAFVHSVEQAQAERRDIVVTVNAASNVSPLDSYTVVALVRGDVLEAPFEEGDVIEKGDVLYRIDTSDIDSSIRQTEEGVTAYELALQQADLSLNSARRNLETAQDAFDDLTLESKVAGQVTKLYYDEDDTVAAGTPVCEIADRSTMKLKVPFHSQTAGSITVGAAATVSVGSETLTGTVVSVSGADSVGLGGILTRTVEISVVNPGGISQGTSATATVGSVACAAAGTFEYNAANTVYAVASGDVGVMHIKEGDYVSKGSAILTIDSTALETQLESARDAVSNAEIARQNTANSLESARKNLEDMYDRLDDYTITAPISGTVVEKNFKVGDTVDAASAATAMAVIYDLSALEVVLNIDERDVVDMAVGVGVTVTADALGDEEYSGVIQRIGINGMAIGGVTSYPVTVRIEETGNLLPGMNVTADILVSEAKDALSIPTGAVTRGNTVLLYDGTSKGDLADGVPEGYRRVRVELGRTDDDYIEVLSGIEEGDIVGITTSVTSIMEYAMMAGPYGNMG